MRRLVFIAFTLPLLTLACGDDSGSQGTGDADVAIPDGEVSDTSTPDSTDGDTTELPDGDTTVPDTTVPPDTSDTVDTTDTTPPDTTIADTNGQQICLPGVRVCTAHNLRAECQPDGLSYGAPIPCAEDEACRDGVCQPRCPNDPKFGVYVGCEFWATDLPNYPDPTLNPTPENLPWALVISNPGNTAVRVGFEMPPLFTYTPTDDSVPGGESRTFQLPNINVQGTSLMPKGVYVVATGPVLVHQFNPWDNRFSNDASMLLPEPLLGRDHVILSWPTSPLDQVQIPGFPTPPNQNGYFTVIAAYPNTNVTFTVSASVRASGAIPKLSKGQTATIRMNRGDVLSIQADPENLFDVADISGTTVSADKPIAVFGGHEQAVVGDPVPDGNGGTTGPCCADHLEEQMLPLEMLSNRYFAPKSPPRGTSQIEDDFWRIQAAVDNVTITTNPPQAGANNVTLAKKGDYITVKTNQTFEVSGTGKLQIGQYLTSADTVEAPISQQDGDPSLVVMVPTERYRTAYAFSVPDGYRGLYATLVRQQGVEIRLDGVPVSNATFTNIGASGWQIGYVSLTPGVHVAESPSRFGLFVYGYSPKVSFAYIGGLAGPGE